MTDISLTQHTKEHKPTISVLMTVYNAAAYIESAIQSILDQTYRDFELIINNDGSTDNTVAVIRQFTDSRIRFFDHSENRGLTYARQTLLEAAEGKYVAILDSDDISFPDRLEKQYRFLEDHPVVVLCGGNALLIDKEGKLTGDLLHPFYRAEELKVRLFFNNIFVHSSVMFRREQALLAGGYRDKAPAEDYDLFVRLAEQHSVHIFNEPLVFYRVHEENISQTRRDVAIARLRTIKEEQLRMLGMDPEIYGAVFDALLWWQLERYTIEDFYRLLVALKSANRNSGKLPSAFFEKELYDRWYKLVLATIPKENATAYLLRKGLFKFSVLSFKQKRRIVKLWLKSVFINKTFG